LQDILLIQLVDFNIYLQGVARFYISRGQIENLRYRKLNVAPLLKKFLHHCIGFFNFPKRRPGLKSAILYAFPMSRPRQFLEIETEISRYVSNRNLHVIFILKQNYLGY